MDKEWDVILFAINQKAEQAEQKMNNNSIPNMFDKGQFQAYSEVYTMISNVKKSFE